MPWAALLLASLPLPFLLSGAVRFLTGWTLGTSLLLCVATMGLALCMYVWRAPAWNESPTRVPVIAALAMMAMTIAWFFRLWWTPVFRGLPNTIWGVDVGNHALLYLRFTEGDHQQYEGFVGLYALIHWYRQTFGAWLSKTNAIYFGIRFAHYVCMLAVPVALGLVPYPALAQLRTTRQQLVASALIIPFAMSVLTFLIFPPAGYYQAEGFYSQIVGVYPLMLGWLCFGLLENPALRFLVCMFWVVVQRFSYGLNLGDLLLTLAYLWSYEAWAIRPLWLRWGAVLFVPVALAAACLVDDKLYALRGAHGYFINHSVPWVLGGQLVLSSALLSAPAALHAAGVSVTDPAQRLWRYAGTFGLVNGALTMLYFAYDAPLEYYILKYSLYPVILVCAASVGPIASVIAHMVSSDLKTLLRRESMRLIVAMLAVGALSAGALRHGHASYRPLAVERYERTRPNMVLFSHYEPKVDAFIDRTLETRNAQFGGYYDPYWPRMFLTDALRFQFSAVPDFVYNRAFERAERMFEDKPGHCYFYLGDVQHYHGPSSVPLKRHLTQLREHQVDCMSFQPRWGLYELRVCAACL